MKMFVQNYIVTMGHISWFFFFTCFFYAMYQILLLFSANVSPCDGLCLSNCMHSALLSFTLSAFVSLPLTIYLFLSLAFSLSPIAHFFCLAASCSLAHKTEGELDSSDEWDSAEEEASACSTVHDHLTSNVDNWQESWQSDLCAAVKHRSFISNQVLKESVC